MRSAHLLLSYIVIFIGVMHIMLAIKLYDTLDFNALWFISGGIMAVFLGFINILMNEKTKKAGGGIWIFSNLLGSIFILLVAWVMRDIKYVVIAAVIVPLFMMSLIMNFSRN